MTPVPETRMSRPGRDVVAPSCQSTCWTRRGVSERAPSARVPQQASACAAPAGCVPGPPAARCAVRGTAGRGRCPRAPRVPTWGRDRIGTVQLRTRAAHRPRGFCKVNCGGFVLGKRKGPEAGRPRRRPFARPSRCRGSSGAGVVASEGLSPRYLDAARPRAGPRPGLPAHGGSSAVGQFPACLDDPDRFEELWSVFCGLSPFGFICFSHDEPWRGFWEEDPGGAHFSEHPTSGGRAVSWLTAAGPRGCVAFAGLHGVKLPFSPPLHGKLGRRQPQLAGLL